MDFEPWLKARQITLDGKAIASEIDIRWLGLISQMLPKSHAVAVEKKS